MKWLKQAQPPVVQIISYTFGGGTITAYVGDKKHIYNYTSPQTIKTLEMHISKEWHGKALEILNKLERIE